MIISKRRNEALKYLEMNDLIKYIGIIPYFTDFFHDK